MRTAIGLLGTERCLDFLESGDWPITGSDLDVGLWLAGHQLAIVSATIAQLVVVQEFCGEQLSTVWKGYLKSRWFFFHIVRFVTNDYTRGACS